MSIHNYWKYRVKLVLVVLVNYKPTPRAQVSIVLGNGSLSGSKNSRKSSVFALDKKMLPSCGAVANDTILFTFWSAIFAYIWF